MPENQVVFFELNLGVLRILLSPRRAESPMERLAQGKRSGTLGMWDKNKISTPWKGKSVKTSKHVIILELYEIEYNDEYVFKD